MHNILLSIILFLCRDLNGDSKTIASYSDFEGPITSVSAGGQYALLTFDGGPHAPNTLKILDILSRNNVSATFFVNGRNLNSSDNEILGRMISDGHEIGISGWTNLNGNFTLSELSSNMQKTSMLIPPPYNNSTAILVRDKLVYLQGLVHVRQPILGQASAAIDKYLFDNEHMQVIRWSIDSHDEDLVYPEEVIKQVMEKVKPGDIILCHDASPVILKYLPGLIDGLHSKYFELLTVTEMRSFPDDKPR